MAIKSSFSSPQITIHQCAPLKKPVFGAAMMKHNLSPRKESLTFQIRSSFRDQVFEDHSKGIVCYKDDKGEIVCEGLDEGPRFHNWFPSTPYHTRDIEIMDFVQQRWLEIVDGGGDNAGLLLEDSKCNGFNK
ncbi:hypothetical protein Ancab_011868 [Ancistrocladus abbreviatus]